MENIINIETLTQYVEAYQLTGEENIFNYSDDEIYNVYSSIKNRDILKGVALSQKFIGTIGKLNTKSIHSFVSRNRITDIQFKRNLIRLLYVLGESEQSNEIFTRIVNIFPRSVLVKSPRPKLEVPEREGTSIETLTQCLLEKELECEVLKESIGKSNDEREALADELKTTKTELGEAKNEIINLKLVLAEKNGAINVLNASIQHHRQIQLLSKKTDAPIPKKPFNRFA